MLLCLLQQFEVIAMAGNKRPLPKDFDVPSLQTKVPRLEGTPAPPVTTAAAQGFVLPTRTLSLPLQGISARTALPSHTSAALIGITGILPTTSPGGPKFEFRGAGQGSVTPSVLPISAHALSSRLARISPSPQSSANLNPFAAAAAAAISLQSFQRAQTPPGAVAAAFPAQYTSAAAPVIRPEAMTTPIQGVIPSLVVGSPVSALPLRAPPPPPYPAPTTASSAEQVSEEFTCSSPSQFLHSPTSVRPPVVTSQATFSASTAESSAKENRQPVSSSGSSGKGRGGHNVKSKLLKHRKAKLAALKLKYEVQLKEKFFLEEGGNVMDFMTWKRKPNSRRDLYLKRYSLESDGPSYSQLLSVVKDVTEAKKIKAEGDQGDSTWVPESKLSVSSSTVTSKKSSPKPGSSKALKSQVSASTASPTRIQIPLSTLTPSLQVSGTVTTPKPITPSSPLTKSLSITPSPRPATRSHASFTSMYETSHEDIVMRARQEAEVMRAIADLRKEGMWSASRLPKVCEPSRKKGHWDYLLEEMQWLATDFANERRWKINSSKKVGSWLTPSTYN